MKKLTCLILFMFVLLFLTQTDVYSQPGRTLPIECGWPEGENQTRKETPKPSIIDTNTSSNTVTNITIKPKPLATCTLMFEQAKPYPSNNTENINNSSSNTTNTVSSTSNNYYTQDTGVTSQSETYNSNDYSTVTDPYNFTNDDEVLQNIQTVSNEEFEKDLEIVSKMDGSEFFRYIILPGIALVAGIFLIEKFNK